MIDDRHVSSVVDVRTLRGPKIFLALVAARIRYSLCAAKHARQKTPERFDVTTATAENQHSQQTSEWFFTLLVLLFAESTL